MSSEFQFDEKGVQPSPAPPPFQVLCLSGGGYRGLYTAMLLEELERDGKPLSQVFDVIAGTSIGGILALGLAAGISAEELRKSFAAKGGAIFPTHYTVLGRKVLPRVGMGLVRSRYSVDGLRDTIKQVLGAASSKTLGELKTPVLIPSVDVTNRAPRLFGLDKTSLSTPLLDVALATSAAPSYFPEHRYDTSVYVDGGLIANAPDVVALLHFLNQAPVGEFHMLSIGTVGDAGGEAARKASRRGLLLGGKKLVDLTFAAQEKLSIDLASRYLGANYIRLDAKPSADQMSAIGLDRTGTTASDTLAVLAKATVKDGFAQHQGHLRVMLNRTSIAYRAATP